MQAQAEEQERARMMGARSGYLNDLAGNMGPPQEFNPARALAAGIKPDEAQLLQGPKPQAPMRPVVLPDGTVLSADGTKVVREAPRAAQGGRIGVVNPEAWTPQSLAQYQQTGDPSVLRRYQAPQPRPAGGGTNTQPPAMADATAQDDRAQLASSLGVPLAKRDPWANMRDSKTIDVSKRTFYTAATKQLEAFDDQADTAADAANDMQRFRELQQSVMAQGFVLGRLPAVSGEAQEMDSITARIVPTMRQPGSGATSDFDAKMFQTATISRTKNAEANNAIAEAVIRRSQMVQDRAQFMRDYVTANGHLDGAKSEWARYARANPIFDPKKPGTYTLNESRVPYQQFFSGQAAKPPATPASPARPAQPAAAGIRGVNLTPEEQAELDGLRKRFGGGAR
jgi:hypothetical protein